MSTAPVVAVFLVIAAMLGFLMINSSPKSPLTEGQALPSSLTPTINAPDVVDEGRVTTSPPQNSATSTKKTYSKAPGMIIDINKKYTAVILTNKGEMTAELNAKETPITVNNFVFLANDKFYDGLKFHRIIKDFMNQTGDPLGTGQGGPGYKFNDEKPITKDYTKGTLAMANAGPNTNGSQFFIMNADYELPKNYVIFGKVTQGLDVVDKIAATEVTTSETGEMSKPTEDIFVVTISIKTN